MVFPKLHKIVLVHGCFWHRHPACPKATTPKSCVEFWNDKFARNVTRDQENLTLLQNGGWRVLTIWECETRDPEQLSERLTVFLASADVV